MTLHERLVTYFRALPREQQLNLVYHAKKGTPICCQGNAKLYTDGFGGG